MSDMAMFRQPSRASFEEAKRVHYFHSELRTRLAGWPHESEHVIPPSATYIALEEHRVATKVLFLLPCRPTTQRKLSEGHILGLCHALKLLERNIARLGVHFESDADCGTLAQVDRPHLKVRVSGISMRLRSVRKLD